MTDSRPDAERGPHPDEATPLQQVAAEQAAQHRAIVWSALVTFYLLCGAAVGALGGAEGACPYALLMALALGYHGAGTARFQSVRRLDVGMSTAAGLIFGAIGQALAETWSQ